MESPPLTRDPPTARRRCHTACSITRLRRDNKSPWASKCNWNPVFYNCNTCPECDVLFVELTTQSLKATKASHCLDHVRKCEAYAQAHGSAEPVRKRAKKTTLSAGSASVRTSSPS